MAADHPPPPLSVHRVVLEIGDAPVYNLGQKMLQLELKSASGQIKNNNSHFEVRNVGSIATDI